MIWGERVPCMVPVCREGALGGYCSHASPLHCFSPSAARSPSSDLLSSAFRLDVEGRARLSRQVASAALLVLGFVAGGWYQKASASGAALTAQLARLEQAPAACPACPACPQQPSCGAVQEKKQHGGGCDLVGKYDLSHLTQPANQDVGGPVQVRRGRGDCRWGGKRSPRAPALSARQAARQHERWAGERPAPPPAGATRRGPARGMMAAAALPAVPLHGWAGAGRSHVSHSMLPWQAAACRAWVSLCLPFPLPLEGAQRHVAATPLHCRTTKRSSSTQWSVACACSGFWR